MSCVCLLTTSRRLTQIYETMSMHAFPPCSELNLRRCSLHGRRTPPGPHSLSNFNDLRVSAPGIFTYSIYLCTCILRRSLTRLVTVTSQTEESAKSDRFWSLSSVLNFLKRATHEIWFSGAGARCTGPVPFPSSLILCRLPHSTQRNGLSSRRMIDRSKPTPPKKVITQGRPGTPRCKMRQPRIERGAHRWQRWILPLNH